MAQIDGDEVQQQEDMAYDPLVEDELYYFEFISETFGFEKKEESCG